MTTTKTKTAKTKTAATPQISARSAAKAAAMHRELKRLTDKLSAMRKQSPRDTHNPTRLYVYGKKHMLESIITLLGI